MAIITVQGTSQSDYLSSSEYKQYFGITENPTYGKPRDEKFLGYDGNDLISPGKGNDYIDGGQGDDTVSYHNYIGEPNFNEPVNINLLNGTVTGFFGKDTLKGIENIFSSHADDTIIGNNQNNSIKTSDGNDLIYGSLGNDTIDGHYKGMYWNYNSNIWVNSPDYARDTINYERLNDKIKVDLNLGETQKISLKQQTDKLTDIEYIYGTNYNDTLIGNTENNLLVGNAGKDSLVGGSGNDSLVGYGNSKYGQEEIDTLIGGLGADKFILNWYNNQVPYDDGKTSDLKSPSPVLFGMNKVNSVIGWRKVQKGSRFHQGIDYGSGGQPKDIRAGVSGIVTKAGGGNFNLIAIKIENGNTIEYLHCSQVNVSPGQPVTPSTIIGKTGDVGSPGSVHLHLQARNNLGEPIHPEAALNTLTTDDHYTKDKWPQGIDDYAFIKDFDLAVDKIILSGTVSDYYRIYFPTGQSIFPSAGTAIIFDNDGSTGVTDLNKADELVAFIPNQQLTDFTGFQFSG